VVKPTKKFGDDSLMLWGRMSARGVGNAYRILTTTNFSVYIEILRDRPSTVWLLPYPNAPYILQQDNDPKHTSCVHGWERTTWPHSLGRRRART